MILLVTPNSVRFLTSKLVLLCFVHVFDFDLECPIWLDHVLVLLPNVKSILFVFYSWIWGSCAYFIQLSYYLILYLSLIFLCLFPHEIELCINCFTLNLILILRFAWNILLLIQFLLIFVKDIVSHYVIILSADWICLKFLLELAW